MRHPARPAQAHRHRGNPASWPRRLAVIAVLAVVSTTALVTGIATPAFAGSLVSPGWAASATAPGTLGVDYTYTFTTASTSELDSVTMTVPAGTGGLPAVGTITPAGLADGGSVTMSGGVLTYSFTPGLVDAGTAVSVEITGLTSATVAGSYTSDIATVDAGTPVDSGTTPAVSFSGGPGATCDNATLTPSCSTSVTFTVATGPLGVTAPPSQSWSTTLNGTDQDLVDTADASFTVQDITGSGGGWTVTATATQFTGAGADGNTLAPTGTMVYAGSGTDETSSTIPGAACAPATACVVPTTTGLTLPAPVTQNGTTLVNLYDAEANTGMGTILIGAVSGGAPAAWWVNVPAGARADTYSAVITLAVSTGPVGT